MKFHSDPFYTEILNLVLGLFLGKRNNSGCTSQIKTSQSYRVKKTTRDYDLDIIDHSSRNII